MRNYASRRVEKALRELRVAEKREQAVRYADDRRLHDHDAGLYCMDLFVAIAPRLSLTTHKHTHTHTHIPTWSFTRPPLTFTRDDDAAEHVRDTAKRPG